MNDDFGGLKTTSEFPIQIPRQLVFRAYRYSVHSLITDIGAVLKVIGKQRIGNLIKFNKILRFFYQNHLKKSVIKRNIEPQKLAQSIRQMMRINQQRKQEEEKE